MKYRLMKLDNISTFPFINNGEELIGSIKAPPSIGDRFDMYDDSGMCIISTSMVTGLIDKFHFKTKNSIYKLISIQDDRDIKLDDILG